MPFRPRVSTGNLVFHVFNRAVQEVVLFESSAEYGLFSEVLAEAVRRFPVRLLAYALMPNHWHLVVWTETDDSLSEFMQWLTATHARRWRKSRGTCGRGAVYQGRYKAIVVQHDRHLLRLIRYVERNAVRKRLVERATDWAWSSASPKPTGFIRPALTEWPVERPADWLTLLDTPEPPKVLRGLRATLQAGRHYGSPSWRLKMAEALRWRNGLRTPGRPIRCEVETTAAGRR